MRLDFYRHLYAKKDATSILTWLSTVRLLSLSAVLITLLIRLKFSAFNYKPAMVIALLVFFIFLNLIFFVTARERLMMNLHPGFVFLLFLIDLAAITLAVHFSGGIHSRLSFLYVIPAISAVLLPVRSAILLILGITLSYLGLLYGEYTQFIPSVPYWDLPLGKTIFVRSVRLFLLIFISILSCFYYSYKLWLRDRQEISSRDESLTDIASHLSTPLKRVKSGIKQLRKMNEDHPTLDLIEAQIEKTQELTDELLEEFINTEPVPVVGLMRYWKQIKCGNCSRYVPLFGRYFGIPPWYKDAFDFGPYTNDIHCSYCHETSAGAYISCQVCLSWTASAKKTALNSLKGRNSIESLTEPH